MLAAKSNKQLEHGYLLYVYATSANSYVDRLNTEGGRFCFTVDAERTLSAGLSLRCLNKGPPMTSQAVFRPCLQLYSKNTCLSETNGSIVLSD